MQNKKIIKDKLEIVKNTLIDNNADAFLFASDQNRFWYTQFMSSAGYLIVTKKDATLLIDGRYIEAAKKNIKNANVVLYKNLKQLLDFFTEKKIKNILIEEEYLTYQYQTFFDKNNLIIKPYKSTKLRAIKNNSEIASLKKVAEITTNVSNKLKKYLKPGMSEISIAKWITIELIKAGGEKNSFDPIVASGPNGSVPHHHPTNRKLLNGEFVTCDFGTIYNNYSSDLTRTFVLGKPKNQKMINVYRTVQESNKCGKEKVSTKVSGEYIHNLCKEIISKKGYEKYFPHGTGHGVGIDIHEEPYVNSVNNELLPENSIVTIEPGIYIPGIGGVRIEDMMLVKSKNSICLTEKAEIIKV